MCTANRKSESRAAPRSERRGAAAPASGATIGEWIRAPRDVSTTALTIAALSFGILVLSIAWASIAHALPPAIRQATGAGGSLAAIQAELTSNQAKWAENGADDYSYRMQRSCFCPFVVATPGIVKVRGGEIVEVSPVGAFGALDPVLYLTVGGLFEVIQDAIDQNADEIIVSWDPQLGYPTDIYVDRLLSAVDDEVGYSARDLVLGTGYAEHQAVLDDALDRWNAAGVAHYRFWMQLSCFCPPETTAPGLVEVLEGEIVSVVDPNTGGSLAPENYLTVPGLFDVAQGAIDFEVWQLSAAYDPVLGYPTEISTDAAEFLADDEMVYAASDLVDLPEPQALLLELSALAALRILARRRADAPRRA